MPTDFANKVYDACKKIPKGCVSTYKLLAEAIDKPKAVRAIGTILSKNPYAPIVPCHRVVKSDGSLGGFMGKTDIKTVSKKVDLLVKEGVSIKNGYVVDFDKVRYTF